MTFAMDFMFAGPTNLPYVREGPTVPATPHVKAVNPSRDQNCKACLRTALGCGSAPSLDALEHCQALQEGIEAITHLDCTLQSRIYSPFPVGDLGNQCLDLCALDPPMPYGSGYTRPYVDSSKPS